jgi:hypothetical protein
MNTNYILSVYDPDVAWHFCLIPRQYIVGSFWISSNE